MNCLRVSLMLSALLTLPSHAVAIGGDERNGSVSLTGSRVAVLQAVTNRLRLRLEILEQVEVTLVAHNPLVMSVETRAGRSGPFVISVDEAFAASLTSDELEAALAHELGHVWIYTHHPYLQTERLANDIAMRVVPRSSLEPVYEKVFKRTGIKGNLAAFIGEP